MTRDEKLQLVETITRGLIDRHGSDGIVAVGVHGSVARGDDDEHSDLDVAVVTAGPEVDAPSRALRLGATVVDVGCIPQAAYLEEAGHIGPAWPVASDQYVSMHAVHDPTGFFTRLRAAHEEAVKTTPDEVFLEAAGYDLVQGFSQEAKARRALARGDGSGALFAVREGALLAACALGLIARTPYHGAAAALTAAAGARMPPGFAETFRLATAVDSDPELAVSGLGEALATLAELARRDGVPFEATGAADFL